MFLICFQIAKGNSKTFVYTLPKFFGFLLGGVCFIRFMEGIKCKYRKK